jgi:hypothetical protein
LLPVRGLGTGTIFAAGVFHFTSRKIREPFSVGSRSAPGAFSSYYYFTIHPPPWHYPASPTTIEAGEE